MCIRSTLIISLSSLRLNYIDVAIFSTCHMRSGLLLFMNKRILATAVIVYDWILTFPEEIRVIWTRKMTGAKILFLLNRYLWVAGYLLQLMFDFYVGLSNTVSISDHDYDMTVILNRSSGVRSGLYDYLQYTLMTCLFSCSRLGTANHAFMTLHDLSVSGGCITVLDTGSSYVDIRAL